MRTFSIRCDASSYCLHPTLATRYADADAIVATPSRLKDNVLFSALQFAGWEQIKDKSHESRNSPKLSGNRRDM